MFDYRKIPASSDDFVEFRIMATIQIDVNQI